MGNRIRNYENKVNCTMSSVNIKLALSSNNEKLNYLIVLLPTTGTSVRARACARDRMTTSARKSNLISFNVDVLSSDR